MTIWLVLAFIAGVGTGVILMLTCGIALLVVAAYRGMN